MNNNQFFQFLLIKLNDLVYQMKESNSVRPNLYESEIKEYPLFDDFFIFFQSLNVSEEQLFEYLQKNNSHFSLAELLFGNELANDMHRKNKIEQFLPLLENNFSFFQECFATCLKTHKYIPINLQQKNQDYFLTLLHVGMKKNYFQLLNDKDKETDFPNYKDILIEFNIFQQNYDISKTIDSIYPFRLSNITPLKKNSSPSNTEILKHFIMFYEPIYEFLINLNEEKWLSILKDNFPDFAENSNPTESLLNKICYFLFQTPLQKNIDACSKIFENAFIRKNLMIYNKNTHTSDNGIISLFSIHNLLNKTFHLFSENEKKELFAYANYSETSLFYHFVYKNNPYIEENDYYLTIEKVLQCIQMNDLSSNQIEKNSNTVLTTTLFNNLSVKTSKKTIENLCQQYQYFIINAIDFQLQDEKLKFLLEKIHLLTHDNPNLAFIQKSIHEKIILLFEDFLQTPQDVLYQQSYSITNQIKKMTSFLNIYEDLSFLNHFNNNYLNWSHFQFDYSKKLSNKKHTYIASHNIMFYLFEHLSFKNQEKFMDWITQKENIEQFHNLTINNKNILPYYKKENPKIYEMIIDHILDKPHAFFQLLLKNKKELKQALLISNPNIQTKLQYHILQQKTAKKMEDKKVIKI
jgi:hypothetical protein